jgi:UDP-GlcNAc:undecaprenyl-phosphate/decaprenyl-phosphate GlcNAc-1-phosphate transferase
MANRIFFYGITGARRILSLCRLKGETMKRKIAWQWVMVLGFVFLAPQVNAEDAPAIKTKKDKVSYGIGVDVARNFKKMGIDFDTDILVKGLRDGLAGDKLLMTEDDLRATMNAYQEELRQKMVQMRNLAAETNKREGDAFLAANKTKNDVVTLPSGLQYKIIKAGEGRKPIDTDIVECNYRGSLINGTEFDSSYRQGKPVAFKVNGIIPGWTEALKLMPEGSKWQLFIPSQLAYGERGAGRDIGPNATLIFEVELLSIK